MELTPKQRRRAVKKMRSAKYHLHLPGTVCTVCKPQSVPAQPGETAAFRVPEVKGVSERVLEDEARRGLYRR
jgi:hypothetical protein